MKMRRIYQLVDRLALGYELQLQRFREMRDLARRQQEVVRAGGGSHLEEILARRQALMEEIDETGRELSALREEVQQILHFREFNLEKLKELVQTPSCTKLGEILRELAGVIEEIQDCDRESTALLEGQIKAVRDSLQDVRALRAANRAYQAKPPDGGSFLDLKK